MIGNKLKFLILRNLLAGKQMYTDLLKGIHDINKKILTENLRSLEKDGIIDRKAYVEEIPVKVEYSLSEIGESLTIN